MLGGREARHARDPLVLAHVVARLADEPQDARALVPLEDLRRAVARARCRSRHEVDPGMQVERDLRVDDVRLVAREERHHEPHPTVLPEDLGRRVDDALGRAAVDHADHLLHRPAPRLGELRPAARARARSPATTSSKRSAR